MQERCQALLAEAGFAQYEVCAYARPGRQCAHNLNYWRFGDYLGIGAGAHGKLTLGATQSILRRWKVKHPARLPRQGRHAGGDRRRRSHRRRARRPSTTCSTRCAWSRASRWREFEARTGLAARGHRAATRAGAPNAAGWTIERRPRRADRTGPTLHQRRDRAVPATTESPRRIARPRAVEAPAPAPRAAGRRRPRRANYRGRTRHERPHVGTAARLPIPHPQTLATANLPRRVRRVLEHLLQPAPTSWSAI